MKTYFRILTYATPFGWLMPQYLLLTLCFVIFSVVNLSIMLPLLNVLFSIDIDKEYPLPEFSMSVEYFIGIFYYYFQQVISMYGKSDALYFLCIMLVCSALFANLFKYLANLVQARIKLNVITNLRNDFFDSLLRFDLRYFSISKRGDLISRGTSDILSIEHSVVSTFVTVVRDPLLIVSFFFILFKMSVMLTLYSLILLPVSGLIISQITKKLRKSAIGMQEILGNISSVLDETIGGIRVVKAFAAESYVKKKFTEKVKKYGEHDFIIAKVYNLAPVVSETSAVVTLNILLLLGGQLIFSESSSFTPSEFIVFIVIFSQILPPAKSLVGSFTAINRGIASAQRVFKIMDEPVSIKSKKNVVDCQKIKESICFNNISFSYGEDLVLENVNFEIPQGRMVALVGPSGGGKSTISDLLPRFYDPQQGEVLLDNVNIKDFKISQLRKLMGIVTQESILFNDTVFNNIAFGSPNSHIDEVKRAATAANAHDFIEELPLGYDTFIGDRGIKLSGGQRQRISIARALLKNPPILILDEATSALDSVAEKLVQEAINNLMKYRTTLVIAHRLSTIKNAHEILVIEKGKIIERGAHDQLIKQNGLYEKLISMQSF